MDLDSDNEDIPQLVEVLDGTDRAIPVTVLAGFLGSGKTTLLNHILTESHGKRIAVIENEFGEGLGIESMIAKSGVDGTNISDFFELANGCVSVLVTSWTCAHMTLLFYSFTYYPHCFTPF